MSADDPDAERNAEHWWRLQAEALAVAKTMNDRERERLMHYIADAYGRLAERVELSQSPKE